MGRQDALAFSPAAGIPGEKRPRCEAHFARAGSLLPLCFLAPFVLPVPTSPLGTLLTTATRIGLFAAVAYNVAWGLTLCRLRYDLGPAALGIRLGLRTLHIPYESITGVARQEAPWVIAPGGPLTYAREVPQLIGCVAQLGSFVVEGRRRVCLFSTLGSYHHPNGFVLITTRDGRTYGLSPADPDGFLRALDARRGQATEG